MPDFDFMDYMGLFNGILTDKSIAMSAWTLHNQQTFPETLSNCFKKNSILLYSVNKLKNKWNADWGLRNPDVPIFLRKSF